MKYVNLVKVHIESMAIHVQYTQTESIRLRHFTIRLDLNDVDLHYRKSRSVK